MAYAIHVPGEDKTIYRIDDSNGDWVSIAEVKDVAGLDPDRNALLCNVETRKDKRGKGYAKKLLNYILKCEHRTLYLFAIQNEIACKMYDKLEFKETACPDALEAQYTALQKEHDGVVVCMKHQRPVVRWSLVTAAWWSSAPQECKLRL